MWATVASNTRVAAASDGRWRCATGDYGEVVRVKEKSMTFFSRVGSR